MVHGVGLHLFAYLQKKEEKEARRLLKRIDLSKVFLI